MTAVRHDEFDIVILDNKLPDCDGIDIIPKLKEIRLELRVVMLSGYISSEVNARALAMGAEAFFPKPLDLSEVLPLIKTLIEKTELSQKLKDEQ